MIYPAPKLISFRDKINDIKSTTYLTHSLYYHPAKFIPQIVRYCLDKYCKKNGAVLDPFAGSGTMGVEAATRGYKAYMLDINPLLDYFYPLKIPNFSKQEWESHYADAKYFLEEVLRNDPIDVKKINDNINYWYPFKLYEYFCRIWTNYHELKNHKNIIAQKVIALCLFKISKYFSYAEHSMPKLFISKRKRIFIDKKLKEETLFPEIIAKAHKELSNIKKSVDKLIDLDGYLEKAEYYPGVDSSEFDFNILPDINCIITSPPYLQAQEYMRTFKLEMMWAGISQENIKNYISKEIPFRKAPSRIEGVYIESIRNNIKRKDLLQLYDSYFWFTIKALENASKKLIKSGKLCVLIGNPKMNGIEVEIWKVIYEYFTVKLNFNFISVYEDKIVARKLFKGRNNQNPEGMKSEYLIILEKT
jgi:DNA modification methylase